MGRYRSAGGHYGEWPPGGAVGRAVGVYGGLGERLWGTASVGWRIYGAGGVWGGGFMGQGVYGARTHCRMRSCGVKGIRGAEFPPPPTPCN